MGSITSDEVNFIVYRYLQESGFTHAAYALANESMIGRANINGSLVPPGCLVSTLQKGLQYLELETHLSADGSLESQCNEPFSLVYPHVCRSANGTLLPMDRDAPGVVGGKRKGDKDKGPERDAKKTGPREVSADDALTLQGHGSEVIAVAWSPTTGALVSASADNTARVWSLPQGPITKGTVIEQPVVCVHASSMKTKDVTTVDWAKDGSLVATGCYDGIARVYNPVTGALLLSLARHRAPIIAVRWNRKGDSLLTGSADKTCIIWDAATGAVKQQFEFHQDPVLDIDWRDNTTFCSCSTDKTILVCRLGELSPVRIFRGHTEDVNAVRWDPTGSLIASCSDDMTACVWSMDNNLQQQQQQQQQQPDGQQQAPLESGPMHVFSDHKREIYTIKWSPTGPGTVNPSLPLVFATASLDGTARIYDVVVGVCLFTLTGHTEPVYSVAFSPNGEYIASGSLDASVFVWSARDGSLSATYKGTGGVMEVAWNSQGNKIAACCANNTVTVFDYKSRK